MEHPDRFASDSLQQDLSALACLRSRGFKGSVFEFAIVYTTLRTEDDKQASVRVIKSSSHLKDETLVLTAASGTAACSAVSKVRS